MGKVKILKLENDKVEMGCDEIRDTIENGDFVFLYIPEYCVMTYPRVYVTSDDGPEPPRKASEEPDKGFGFCDIRGSGAIVVLEDGSIMFDGGPDSGGSMDV